MATFSLRPTGALGRLALAALVASSAVPALAGAEPPPAAQDVASPSATDLDTLVIAVAAWVAQAMGVPLPAELPGVAFASAQEMAALRYGDREPVLAVVALYEEATQTLVLPRGWTGATEVELSMLVHEMVHFLQAAEGRRFACGAEREAEAYDVQQKWLEQFGTGLEAEFGIDGLTRLVLTTCGIG